MLFYLFNLIATAAVVVHQRCRQRVALAIADQQGGRCAIDGYAFDGT